MINVAIVEDIDDLREAIASMVQDDPDLLCIYKFGNAEDALNTLREDPVDVVLMDINLPRMSGIECVRQLKVLHPSMLFLMCTIFQQDDHIFNALKAGASGYLLKGEDAEKITAAIKEVHAGGSPMNAHIARKIIESFHAPSAPTVLQKEADVLTVREMELLRLLAKGLRYKEIAAEVRINIETVRKHISNIYTKLHVQSRMDAINKVYPR
jgi:DNA-binding NarL/FixJ family response regulator